MNQQFLDFFLDTTLSSIDDKPARSVPVNVASVPQRSPFRYPGGKTWLVPTFRKWMRSLARPPRLLLEPFAGGGIIGLTAAFENLSQHVHLVELDDQMAAVWKSIIQGDAEWLAQRIVTFEMTLANLREELKVSPTSLREAAFQTLLRNRTAHGGILAAGAGVLKNGENGRGLTSRWYPQTLASRLRNISAILPRLTFQQADAFDVISQHRNDPEVAFFIDPPYTAGGKRAGQRLYTHSQIDHDRLFSECAKFSGPVLMTYDNAPEVSALASRYHLETRAIAMKNTHHAAMTELLISKNLDWLD